MKVHYLLLLGLLGFVVSIPVEELEGSEDTAAVALPLTQGASISRTMKITGLNAGSNTFTAKYKATCAASGVIQFSNRDLVVFP